MESAPRRKIPYARPLAIALAAFAVYALLGFFVAPPLIKRAIVNYAAETLHRKASVGDVRVNPLLLSLEIGDFALAESGGAPIVGVKRFFARFAFSSLVRAAWTFSEITLDGLDLRADIAPDGRFNLTALLDSLPRAEPKPQDKPPRVVLRHVVLSNGSVSFSDRSIAVPASATLASINLEVHDLSTLPDSRGGYTVAARFDDGSSIHWRGEASLQPLASRGELAVTGAKLATAWRFLRGRVGLAEPRGELDFGARYDFRYAAGATQLTAEEIQLSGRGVALGTTGPKSALLTLSSLQVAGSRARLDVARGKPWQATLDSLKLTAADLDFTDGSRATPIHAASKQATVGFSVKAEERPDGPQALLEGIAVNLAGLSVGKAGAAQPVGTLDTVAIEDGTLDLAERRLGVGRIAVSGGELHVMREKDGNLPLLKLFAPADGGVAQEAKSEDKPWRTTLDELTLNGTRISISDLSFGGPVTYDVRDLRFAVHGYASDGQAPVKFDAALRLEQGGSLSASGEALLSGAQAELRVKLDRINLAPLQPAVAARARVKLASGELSAELKASRRLRGGKPGLLLDGTLRVDNFLVNEAEGGERLLAWKALTVSGLNLSLAPDQLKIKETKLEGLGAKIVVFKDRSLNLAKALIPGAGGDGATKPAADRDAPFPVAVDRVRFQDCIVDFTDLSLVLPFGAEVHEMNGLVEGASTDPASRASVKLEGRVDEYGLARAEGSLEPFRPTDFMDLSVIFRNVEMPKLSPYSATFAGRRIDSGRLSLDLRYKINKGQLAGDNRVVLEKFTLGERVESPGAVNLPLDLAVALLTDSDGKIDLAMPVTGDVNDPKFSYGPLVWQAIRTAIAKIVSAPFRALSALFGGGSGENLEAIAFDPGRAALLPPEQEKLKHVAEGLTKRPQLRLVAEGETGPADRAALQQLGVELAVAARLGRTPAAGAAPGPVNVADAKTQRALEALFIERQSEDALAKFAADTAKSRNREVDRVSAVLALIGKASSDREFYEALLKRLNETTPVPDAALAQLAGARAQAVASHMTSALAIPAERTEARTAKAPGKAQVKLELDTAAAR
ncbi:MAG TPA: DUF748 domain-containing protein [Burkholderiales bacterium]|nr:DUF748 domain-containing protein [Burkholderiales bacterium]